VVTRPACSTGGPSLLRCILHWLAEPEGEAAHLDALRQSALRPDQVSTPHLASKVYCRCLTPSGEPVGDGERNARGEPHGKGTMVFAHGAGYYVGDWRRGKMEGEGKFFASSGERYVGQFVGGERSGRGAYDYDTGDRYEGEYSRGLRHGSGTMIYSNGDRCQGRWAVGQLDGTATYTYADGAFELGRYRRGVEVDEGVAWNAARGAAWRTEAGAPREAISLAEASDIATKLTSADLRRDDDARAAELLAGNDFLAAHSPRRLPSSPGHDSPRAHSPFALRSDPWPRQSPAAAPARPASPAKRAGPPSRGLALTGAAAGAGSAGSSAGASIVGGSPLVRAAAPVLTSQMCISPLRGENGSGWGGGTGSREAEARAPPNDDGAASAGAPGVPAAAVPKSAGEWAPWSAPDGSLPRPPSMPHLASPMYQPMQQQTHPPAQPSRVDLSHTDALLAPPSPVAAPACPPSAPPALAAQMLWAHPPAMSSPSVSSPRPPLAGLQAPRTPDTETVVRFSQRSVEEEEEMAILEELYDAERTAIRQSKARELDGVAV
jgi:hypothetical protein